MFTYLLLNALIAQLTFDPVLLLSVCSLNLCFLLVSFHSLSFTPLNRHFFQSECTTEEWRQSLDHDKVNYSFLNGLEFKWNARCVGLGNRRDVALA